MANWGVAYDWMMDFEDPQRECKQVPDAAPAGVAGPCYAISGINSGAWPEDFEQIAAKDQADRASPVKWFYEDRFWNKYYDQLASDEVAKRVFDMAVNAGPGTAVRILQRAVNVLQPGALTVDGGWGPATIGAVNAADPTALTDQFKQQRVAYYQDIVEKNPASEQYLAQWTARAQK